MRRAHALALVLALGACGDNSDQGAAVFHRDGTRVLGAWRIDGLAPGDPSVTSLIDDRLVDDGVALLYGHVRDGKTTPAMVEDVLRRTRDDGLAFTTFAELATGAGTGPAVALTFDDADYAAWTALRPIFARYHARATFFVTRFRYATAEDRAALAALAVDGHDIEAHGVDHEDAVAYAAAHGIDALLADQIVPSFADLRAAGYAPLTYAHPFGATTPAIDDAILATGDAVLVRRITTP